MNKIRSLACALFAALLALNADPCHAKEYVLLGKLGDTLLCDDATSKTQGIAKLDLYKDEIGEAVMGEDSEGSFTLYVQSAADHESYLLHPFARSKKYEKLPCQEGEFFRGILYDKKNKGPAVVAQKDTELADLVTIIPGQRRVKTDIDDCIFIRSNVVRERIPRGHQSAEEMANRFPKHESEMKRNPSLRWILAGQSALITSYNRGMPGAMAKGGKRKNTQLFVSRKSGDSCLHHNDDVGNTYTYDEVVVVRGEARIEGDYSPLKYSGNYCFYFPGADEVVKCTVDPKMMIVFTDPTTAFFAKGNDLYKMPISRTGCGTPAKFLSLDFEVFQMFPVPEKKP